MDWWRRWELMDDYEGFCVLCSLYSNNSNAQAEVLKCKTFCVEPVDKARRILQEVSISCVDKLDHHFVYGLSCKYDCRCAYDIRSFRVCHIQPLDNVIFVPHRFMVSPDTCSLQCNDFDSSRHVVFSM